MAPVNDAKLLEMAEGATANGAPKPVDNGAETDVNEHEDKEEPKKDFVPSTGLTTKDATDLLAIHGRNELEEKSTPSWVIFLKQLYGPMPIMIWIAIVIEFAIQNYIDAGILLGIQFANATIGWYETTKAGNAVAALKASLKPVATAKRDGTWQQIDAGLLVPGDLVLLGSGSAVPADCLVNHGQIEVDQSALTGESMPVTMFKGDQPKMGSTVARGETEATVEFTGKNTFFGKTASMLQQDQELGNLQKILLRIMAVLVITSLVLCITAFIYIMVKGESFKHALQFIIVLLVASIPIAIEIVCTATLALGSRQLSAHGAIVTRLTAIEEMAGMNMLCSDKTGTLTLNKMEIQEDCPIYTPGETQATVIRYAALAAKWKEPPRDALDTLVLGVADLPSLDVYNQTEYLPFDPILKRTEASLIGPDGKPFRTAKGAPHVILALCHNKEQIERAVENKVHDLGTRGIRSLAVAKTDDEGRWCMMGILTFLDPPRPDTKVTIERAMAYGVDVKMITGDHQVIAKETARVLGMGTNIAKAAGLPMLTADGKIPKNLRDYGAMILKADGFSQVFPEHKYLIVECLRQEGFAVGMTGDGVNDAPALKRADVGIAVSGSTDAARAAADIVLTQEGLSVVVEAIIIARCIFQRIKNFINYRVAATLQLLTFFFIAVFALPPKDYKPDGNDENAEAFAENLYFQLPVLMLMLITLLNDGTLISIAYDNVKSSPRPEKWNLKVLFIISIVLGAVACLSSLLLLFFALQSHRGGNTVFHAFGLPPIPYGQIVTMIYLKVSLSDFLTLFSARCSGPFWSQRPSPILLGAAATALSLSTILACVWPKGHTDDIMVEGLARGDYNLWAIWVWLYCIFWWLVQDACKVLAYWVIFKYNIFGANTAQLVNNRAALDFNDAKRPLARVSAGSVENKLLAMQVEGAKQEVARISAGSNEPNLKRVSQGLARVSMSHQQGLTAVNGVSGKHADVESGAPLDLQVLTANPLP
ncbi:hypothetical protein WJX72_003597 [[Myrmecia] bisecta]|uniref:Plasma membrane ATPase n=1 Tax=[Myrmecia] bisecta TaxID=41462 RepID=A0AAW1Q3Q4_9CHLO